MAQTPAIAIYHTTSSYAIGVDHRPIGDTVRISPSSAAQAKRARGKEQGEAEQEHKGKYDEDVGKQWDAPGAQNEGVRHGNAPSKKN